MKICPKTGNFGHFRPLNPPFMVGKITFTPLKVGHGPPGPSWTHRIHLAQNSSISIYDMCITDFCSIPFYNPSKFAIFLSLRKGTQIFFISCNFIFSPNECPGQHRPGHSLGKKNKVAQNEK